MSKPSTSFKNSPRLEESVQVGSCRATLSRCTLRFSSSLESAAPFFRARPGNGRKIYRTINKSCASHFCHRNLAIGIGIQNFPEGLAVSLPLQAAGISTLKSFWYGQLSGMVEPLAGVLGAAGVAHAQPALPYALAFAAGAMIYVVIDDIVPEAHQRFVLPIINHLPILRAKREWHTFRNARCGIDSLKGVCTHGSSRIDSIFQLFQLHSRPIFSLLCPTHLR